MLTEPSEGVIIQGHGADWELLVSVKYGEAIFRDGKAWMGSVLQEMEECACTGKQPDLQYRLIHPLISSAQFSKFGKLSQSPLKSLKQAAYLWWTQSEFHSCCSPHQRLRLSQR